MASRKVSFGGGEPVCSPLLLECVKRVVALGMTAEVFTCGTVESATSVAAWPDDLIDQLRELPLLKLIFSVHAPDKDIHDSITRVPGSFSAMVDSLTRCVAAGIHCEINLVPLKPNWAMFSELVDLAATHGAKKVSVLRFVPQGRGEANRAALELSSRDEGAFIEHLLSVRDGSGIDIRTGSPFNEILPNNRVPCRAGTQKLVVQADGNVLPCEVFKHPQARNWGLSVYHDSISGILGSEALSGLRAMHKRGECVVCPVHHSLRSRQMRGVVDACQRVPECTFPV